MGVGLLARVISGLCVCDCLEVCAWGLLGGGDMLCGV